jgi:2-oxoglutarate ferredoxin oxidoreductase subunit beta
MSAGDGNGSGNGHKLALTAKDFRTDQEVRWCPGCGDYAILAALQSFMPELGIERERTVFISGIGCAARFPYYMNTYGMHSIHGRAPAIATGLATTRPDLSVWVVTGDGDALSIGGNHLIHALRRNVNLKILLFNNRIYGLTKGQYSPTSELGKVTKSTPMGSLDWPFNPLSLAIGAEATFVARAIDTDKAGMSAVLREAALHRGSAFVEIFQNCPIFNDDAFDYVRDDKEGVNRIVLQTGMPIRWGKDLEKALRQRPDGSIEVCSADEPAVLVHDQAHETSALAFALTRVTQERHGGTPVGVFRNVVRPVYDDLMAEQLQVAEEKRGAGDLEALLHSGETWVVG